MHYHNRSSIFDSTSFVSAPPAAAMVASSSFHEKQSCDGKKRVCTPTGIPPCKTSLSVFEPGWHLYLSFGILSVIGLAASLDATSISPALPVSFVPSLLLLDLSNQS